MMDYRLFDDTLQITLPDEFEDMKEELVNMLYQAENKPQIIKVSKDGKVHITFSKTTMAVTKEVLPQLIKMIKQNFHRMQPASEFYEEKCERLEQIEYCWLDFKGFALDGELYYMNAYPIVNGKMYHVSFCTSFDKKDEWKPQMIEILKTMKDLTREA